MISIRGGGGKGPEACGGVASMVGLILIDYLSILIVSLTIFTDLTLKSNFLIVVSMFFVYFFTVFVFQLLYTKIPPTPCYFFAREKITTPAPSGGEKTH